MKTTKLFLRLLCLAAMTAPAWCGTAMFTVASTQVTNGTPFTLDVMATNVFDVYAFQFDVVWNPSLLRADLVTEGDFLQLAGSTIFDGGTIDNSAGTITLLFDTLTGATPGASGTGVVATLSFTPVGEGISPVQLANLFVLDSSLNDAGVAGAEGSVSVVPEPGTWAMVGLVLTGLWRRRS
jgi:hypothetical protein